MGCYLFCQSFEEWEWKLYFFVFFGSKIESVVNIRELNSVNDTMLN